MINPALLVVIGKGLGTGLALSYFKIRDRIYRDWVYVGPRQAFTSDPIVQFYDASFIANLKL